MGGKELTVFNNTKSLNLREIAARATLRDIRLKGHLYVELRQVGKHSIFFCTLCQTQCFNDSVLHDHLNGNLHSRRYAAAKVSLFGPNPWPFSDGVLFFSASNENDSNSHEVSSNLGKSSNGGNVANGCRKASTCIKAHAKASKYNGKSNCRVIPGVLFKGEVRNIKAKFLGYGHIGAIVCETDDGHRDMSRIWCAWLGLGASDDCKELLSSLKCDFAVMSFSYTYDLGRKVTSHEAYEPFSSGSFFEIDDLGHRRKKKRKSFSDPEDSSDSKTARLSGCSEDFSSKLHTSRLISNKFTRKELRKQKSFTAERTCDICGQPMLLGKDVSTLFNCKTGKLACSSRNTNGAFHLFHTSCLIHWILLCEFATWSGQPTNGKAAKASTRGRKGKLAQKNSIALFCPECQGTGIHIERDELEKPTCPLSEVFLHKLKVIEANKAWMKKPEDLKKCSTGLHFSSDSEKFYIQEKVVPLKLLHFYQADE